MSRLIHLVLLFLSCTANCKVEVSTNWSSTQLLTNNFCSTEQTIIGTVCKCLHMGATQFKWILNGMPVDGQSSFFWVLAPPLPGGIINCGYDDCTVLSDPVTVITPPVIEFLSANTIVDIGVDINLNCEAAGYPEPNIAWYFGDEIIGYASELNILSLDQNKEGEYTCLAHNEAGYVKSVTWITLIGSANVSSATPALMSSSMVSSNILVSSTLTVETLSTSTGSTNDPTTVATNDPSIVIEVSTMLIIIMAVSVLAFTVLLLTLMITIYWCQHKGIRNSERNQTDVDRMTIPTSTSYINASFKDDEYNIYSDEEEMKVELFASDSEGGEVLSAHAYKVQNANLYDCSSREGVSSAKIPIKKTDDVGGHNMIDPNQVADDLLKTTTSTNDDTRENDTNECLNEGEEEGFEGNPMAEAVEKKGLKKDPIKDLENSVHNPHWLSEMKDQNRSHVLSATELVNMVHTLDLMPVEKSKNVHLCRKEFESSPMKFPSSDDWPRETMSNNRYRDIVPTSDTAVTLGNTGDLHSTYINANFIKGFDGYPKAYISCQAPIYDTVPDFWQMVWEQKVDAIVMLTGIFEGGKNKCAKYWPFSQDNDTQVYGKYTIQNVHEESFQNYKLTFLSVSSVDNPTEERDVYHYHFLAWPDFGVPTDGYGMMQLRNSVESIRHPESTLLVHCSAGIGRTGTYIGIDIAIRQYEKDGVVDPLLILQLMRKDRGGMIQTLEQYEFLHRVLSVYVLQNMK